MEIAKKTKWSIKTATMVGALRVGSEVSSICSKTARKLDPPPNKKRRVRERRRGVIIQSVPSGKWQVRWACGESEEMSPGVIKNEGEPTAETMEQVAKLLSILDPGK